MASNETAPGNEVTVSPLSAALPSSRVRYGHSVPCGHHIAEEMPDETYAHLKRFLDE